MSYIIKVGFIGDCNVGKTSIINNYFNISKNPEVTLGVDFKTVIKEYENIFFKLHVWDTSGQEKFKSIVSSYYRELDVVLFVFDVSSIESFENIKLWIEEVDKYNKKKKIKFLIGNKSDKNNLVINFNKARNFAELNDLYFYQTSVVNNVGIKNLFNDIVKISYEKLLNNEIQLRSFVKYDSLSILETKHTKKKDKCCIIQ